MGFSAFFADTRNSSCPAVTSESMFCNDTCKDDFYCQSFEKCCSTGCGRTCQNSTGLCFITRTQNTFETRLYLIRNLLNKGTLLSKEKRGEKRDTHCKEYIFKHSVEKKMLKTLIFIILFCFSVTRPRKIGLW